ncbi:MAG: transposase [Symbiobacterium sp.]|uniref:transposase n=1 Tax=Symbiobacterium sp. TaxID=1971213 RepID=UPI003463C10B
MSTIVALPDQQTARRQLAAVVDNLRPQFPRAVQMLEDAEDDLLAYMSFPAEHRRQLHSTNPLEQLNREISHRTDVVGIFPNREAMVRLVRVVLMEHQGEWTAAPSEVP